MNDIIVGVDCTSTARLAAEHAAELAAAYHANLHVVMCVERGPSRSDAPGRDSLRIDSLAEAEQFVIELAGALPHDRVSHFVGIGDPAAVLCEEAVRLRARAIVVGNRRGSDAARVLGSVAGDVTRRSSCDVLVVNTAPAAAPGS